MPSFTSFDGTPIHYVDEGDGPPVVLLHGFASSADINWRRPGLLSALVDDPSLEPSKPGSNPKEACHPMGGAGGADGSGGAPDPGGGGAAGAVDSGSAGLGQAGAG